jgi:signal transduction histidine kinase
MQAEKMSLNRTTPLIRGFVIVPRTADDIRIVSRPSWWTPGRSLAAIALLLAVIAGITLWNLTLRRIAEKRARRLAEEEISHVKSELKVSERTRLAVELHDTLAQNITGACLKMNAAEQLFESDPKAAAEHLDVAAKTLRSCRNEIRNCLWDLRSQALEENTMSDAIRRTLEPHLDGDVDISVRFEVPRAIFTDNTAHILLSIVRELVLNALRHGRAKAVRIVGCAENGNILFSVQDDGCGFDPETAPGVRQGHFCLQGIRERIKTLNGAVGISSGKKAGTKVRITMPLPAGKGEKV